MGDAVLAAQDKCLTELLARCHLYGDRALLLAIAPSVGSSPQGLSGFSINLKNPESKKRHNYNVKNKLRTLS